MARKKFFIWIGLISLVAACNPTKLVPKGDALYMGARVRITGPDLTVRQKKVLAEDLLGLTRPKPNTKVLGIPIKLFFYNMGGDSSKKGFIRKFFRKLGEPPVLLSSLNLEKNVELLQNHMDNTGFFRSVTKGDTVIRRKRARARYRINSGPQYTIRNVFFLQRDSSMSTNDTFALFNTIRESAPKSLLRPKAPYNLSLIKAERARIDAYVKERGFYFFNPDFLILQVDTTIGEHQVNMYMNVKTNTPSEAFNIYRVNNVFVYSNYSLNTAVVDTNRSHATYFKGYYVIDPEKAFKPRLFEQSLQFNPGDIYNRTDHNVSLKRLINLGTFKFVKNRFEEVQVGDSARLDAYYYLTPFPRKSLQLQITGSTKSNNLTGSEITFSWKNRNTFKAGEIWKINALVGSEVQYGGPLQGFNTYTTGLHTSMSVPRFLVPWMHFNTRSGFVPRTNFAVGYDLLNKHKLYTLNSFKMELGYLWKEDVRKEHELNPVSIQYVEPLNVTQLYADSAAKHPTLQRAIERQFILGANYTYNYNQLINSQPINAIYFNGVVDMSGNLAGLIVPKAKDTNTRQLFGSDFSQYFKVESDVRFYRKLGLKVTWANRLITGLGIPYGNSKELPFIKQFFVGGNNSIRAFRSRSVGPGTFKDTTSRNFLPDQTGDIKLELNTEMRVKFTRVIEGAAFIDAGNIWLFRDNPNKPGGKFSKDFLKQIAIGTGVGLRLDFSFFLIRFDVAFPLRKPYLQGNNWALKEIDFTNKNWRGENIIFNLAIGYPF